MLTCVNFDADRVVNSLLNVMVTVMFAFSVIIFGIDLSIPKFDSILCRIQVLLAFLSVFAQHVYFNRKKDKKESHYDQRCVEGSEIKTAMILRFG